jgi:excisionase family DNA binding protein
MSKRQAKGSRAGRREVVAARRKASAMATVEDLAAALGVGKNMAYELVQRDKLPGVIRIRRRYLIPRVIITRLINGEIAPITIP